MEHSKYLTVGALTKYLKYKFDQDPYLTRVYLKGELSNVKHHSSGHLFFALKDKDAVLRGVMFSRNAHALKFQPEEGQSVLIEGRVSIFESSGQYQIYADSIEMDGIGLLFEKLEKDKADLRNQGYFDDKYKKRIPEYPKKIAIISSQTGAALQDMVTTLKRRYPLVTVTIYNTLMQGSKSRTTVVRSLEEADESGADTIILARGGGSIEDLWTFNEKDVALAVFNMKTPIITGIGHETDTTLVDFVSDLRAPTPTAAAEISVPDRVDIFEKLSQTEKFLARNIHQKITSDKNRLSTLASYYKLKNPDLLYDQQTEKLVALKDSLDSRVTSKIRESGYRLSNAKEGVRYNTPIFKIRRGAEILDAYTANLDRTLKVKIESSRQTLGASLDRLNSLSPTNVLKRGYSYTTNEGQVVKTVDALGDGDIIETTLRDGTVLSKVTEVRNDAGKER